MPPSTAALTIGSAAVSSRTHGRSLSFPKLIMPRHTLDTLRPVLPRFVYLIATSSPSPTRRPYRRRVPAPFGEKPPTRGSDLALSDSRRRGRLHETLKKGAAS